MNVPAQAVDRTFQIEVENSLKQNVPSDWWLRASWRDQTLVVFVSPSTQQSFDLWYDTARQKETLENLCKAIPSGTRSTRTRTSPSSRWLVATAAKAAWMNSGRLAFNGRPPAKWPVSDFGHRCIRPDCWI
jgi:hypothetical protein